MPDGFGLLLWFALFGAVALPVRAAISHSWVMMMVAALCSLILSIAGLYTFGFLIFLAVCLALGSTVALGWQANSRGWIVCLGVALLTWIVIVPGQIGGPAILPWIAAFPLVVVAAGISLLRPLPASLRRADAPGEIGAR